MWGGPLAHGTPACGPEIGPLADFIFSRSLLIHLNNPGNSFKLLKIIETRLKLLKM
jgi:hypothetical protein